MELAEIEFRHMCEGDIGEIGETQHVPVLLEEVLDSLQVKKGGVFLDCTLGGGGHTRAILDANPNNRVVAIDRDSRAIERARKSLASYGSRVEFHHSNFSELKSFCLPHSFDGVLADLGISSDQLGENRGFSFKDDIRLDMRMDENQSFSAYNVVNDFSEKELYAVLRKGGVGKEVSPVVRAILRARPIRTTKELADIVQKAAFGSSSKKRINPATVTFQAIRMEVNSELEEISGFLEQIPSLSKPGGRLAVITFHSLEDKEVTRTMRDWQSAGKWPAMWPHYGKDFFGWSYANDQKPLGKLISRKPIVAGVDELVANPRSRSARLRVFQFFSE